MIEPPNSSVSALTGRADAVSPGAAARSVWSVAGLVHAVADTLASRFAAVTVKGEISGFTRASSGHCYFTLKDSDGGAASMRCALFRRTASLLDFTPTEGALVTVRGRLAVYEPRGELQFVAESMQRSGEGALFEKFLRLKAKLQAEGLFDTERKRALPTHPRRLGVVTSLGAAALRDVCAALARRAPNVSLVIYPSLVQGADAPDALVAAMQLAAERDEIDVLLVCRGGGSLEDLWAFNDERVVRAIAAFPVPVVCGVGHESDVTLADFAADRRAATPTAAAELAAPVTDDLMQELAALARQMSRRLQRILDGHAQRLDACSMRLSRPAEAVRLQHQRLALLGLRLNAAPRLACQAQTRNLARAAQQLTRAAVVLRASKAQRLDTLGARLHALDPRRVLGRGYAWLSTDSGQAVASVAQLQPGAHLHAVLADGDAALTVEHVTPLKAP
ncbi:MAG: exodeoxyribonuclease VII large subunit [Pseudorhodobacter sp.]|nr:exodeoxyribonuclease VII large subunit [Rhizobacter sp.]